MDKLIIFDMDGVLTDSEPAITQASLETLEEYGIKAEFGDFRQFAGMGDDMYIGGVARLHGGTYDVSMKKRAYQIYIETAAERVKVYEWSKPIIEALCNDGYKLAVASASDYDKVMCNIDCIGVDERLFCAIVTGSDVQRKKPAPDIFLKAAEKAGIDPKNCAVAEDSIAGIQAAKAAGMLALAVTTTFDREALENAGADYVTDNFTVLPDIIKKNMN